MIENNKLRELHPSLPGLNLYLANKTLLNVNVECIPPASSFTRFCLPRCVVTGGYRYIPIPAPCFDTKGQKCKMFPADCILTLTLIAPLPCGGPRTSSVLGQARHCLGIFILVPSSSLNTNKYSGEREREVYAPNGGVRPIFGKSRE